MPIHVPGRPEWSVGSLLSATHKSELARKGYTQRVVHLLPARKSIEYAKQFNVDTRGWHNLCRGSTRGCRAVCLTYSGRMPMSHRPQFVRSWLWQSHRDLFVDRLAHEIAQFVRRCDDQPVIRLYGTHDGAVEVDIPDVVSAFPDVIFNDYTKLPIATGWVRDNVYRCKSATEDTTYDDFMDYAVRELNHAVPFDLKRNDPLPEFYYGIPVVDGDIDDLRFLDPHGVIVGLRYKVAAKTDKSLARGFIRSAVTPVMVQV
jgi:hypothetical protein